ncbi:MAG: arsenic transporter [Candidatus Acidulodesulfobacterium acidiphilum]|uniref:Arsenical pump membrane protein n=1 Tax=Candidatus Acidulodesulfobacterium acidiphilum TaxID=2597224 RepID=A0A520XAL7_9DELT|nr:MAG: arsenic transporter [Candidatus Acidulodesulfobacterium acidiphilum]
MVTSVIIFLFTLFLIIKKPYNIGIGWSAVIGALLALIFNVIVLKDVIKVFDIVWDATFTFVAIIIISIILDEIGFFEWAALHIAKLAGGSGRKMFVYVILLGALVSALFANDGAALIITPIIYEKMKALKFERKNILPFIMAGGFIADAASIPFKISNLVNIVSADYFNLGFFTYFIDMYLPDIFSIVISVIVLFLYFRKDIPKSYDVNLLKNPREAIKDRSMFKFSFLILALLLGGYFLSEFLNLPVSAFAITFALLFVILGFKSPAVNLKTVFKNAPWNIVVFSLGMYLVVFGLKNAGLTFLLGKSIAYIAGFDGFAITLYTGYLAAFISSIMNNMPTVMINSLAIHSANLKSVMLKPSVYANVIGCDLGPKLTPIGSLATLLWLNVLERKGIKITWGYYMKVGFIITLPVLFVTLLGLYIRLFLF